MNNDTLPNNHYSLKITTDVRTLCEPFFKKFKLSAFFHARVFNNGTSYLLTSHRDWYIHHVKMGYTAAPNIPDKILKDKFCYFITPYTPYQQVLHDLRSLFNLDHLFYLFERQNNYYDMYCFCSTPNNDGIINFYFNNQEIINEFILDFKDKAHNLIKQSDKNRIVLPKHMQTKFKGLARQSADSSSIYTFSKREVECLRYLNKGKTMKEIAKCLELSPRTIEFYLDRIKTKLSCHTKSEVLTIISNLNIL